MIFEVLSYGGYLVPRVIAQRSDPMYADSPRPNIIVWNWTNQSVRRLEEGVTFVRS